MRHSVDYVTIDGQKVEVELFMPEGNVRNQAILFLHGWTGKPNTRAAKLLAENGYTALTVVFRGHPGSDGDMSTITRQNALDDAIAAYDYLKSNLPEGMPICVTGSSYGGYTAAILSSERKMNGLSLRVAANYPDEGFELPQEGKGNEDPRVAKWRTEKLEAEATKSLRAVHAFKGKIQILEAELDEVIPHQTTQNYVDAASDKLLLDYHLMKGWPHSLGDDEERNKDFQTLLLKWLEKL
jgi:esterase/lipase